MTETDEVIFLCGFMAAGKTAVGQALAKELRYEFYDLDKEIERKAGRRIKNIFKQSGEQRFREMEQKAMIDFLQKKRCIVALGGGALQNQQLTAKIKNNSLLVFIDCPVSVILERLRDDKTRPLLLEKDGSKKDDKTLRKELKMLYEKRLPLYKQAKIVIDSSAFSSPQETALYLKNKVEVYER